jgi:hypothetical protein
MALGLFRPGLGAAKGVPAERLAKSPGVKGEVAVEPRPGGAGVMTCSGVEPIAHVDLLCL